MENAPATTPITSLEPSILFDNYWVISAGTEIDLGHAHCATIFVLADKTIYSLEDAMDHAHVVADELREELIEDNVWATEDLIDWEAYDPDELYDDMRYEIMYEFGLEHSDVWAEALDNWDELIRVATYSDEWDVWVVGADPELIKAMYVLVSDMVDGAGTVDIESLNCGDTTNTPNSSNK